MAGVWSLDISGGVLRSQYGMFVAVVFRIEL